MKRGIPYYLSLLSIIVGLVFVPIKHVQAVNQCTITIQVNGTTVPQSAVPNGQAVTILIDTTNLMNPSWPTSGPFSMDFGWPNSGVVEHPSGSPDENGVLHFELPKQRAVLNVGSHNYTLKYDVPGDGKTALELCEGSYTVSSTVSGSCSISIDPKFPSVQDTIKATFTNNSDTEMLRIVLNGLQPNRVRETLSGYNDVGKGTITDVPVPNYGVGTYRLIGETHGFVNRCTSDFEVTTTGVSLENQFVELCSFVNPSTGNTNAQEDCRTCVNDQQGIWTAIGCIPATLDGFVKKILPFAMGIGGGIAFLLMLFGALQIMTSAGNPEKLNAGKELVTSAVVGLLLIIFSIFLLRLIGVSILGIPGFK